MNDPLHPNDPISPAPNAGPSPRLPPPPPISQAANAGPSPRLPPPPPRPRSQTLSCLFTLSLMLNFGAILVLVLVCASFLGYDRDAANMPLTETYYSGTKTAKNKIAIIHLDGPIMEGLLSYPHRQIEQAAKDDEVKAVVFRIDSPGGSITASDDLHHRLVELRDGNSVLGAKAKPLVVSMGSMAASGGYYVAMPGKPILAERTTLTGSIGVYAAFPTIAGLAEKYEFGMNTIKQGEIKDSGSPFRKMSPKEQQVWQDMVDHAYTQFLEVVADGRKDLLTKDNLLEPVDVTPVNAAPARLKEPAKPYQRYRADGGVYTSDVALQLKLVDQIGYLEDAVKVAEQAAGGGDLRAIEYKKPQLSLQDLVLGGKTAQPNNSVLDPGTLRKGMMPRVWYLAPGCELAGVLGAMEEK